MRKHLLTTGLLLTVLALLVLAGRHAAADAPNVNAKPSPDLRVNGDIYDQMRDGFTSGKVSEWRTKIAAGSNATATVTIDLITDGGAGNQTDDGVTSGTVSGQGTKIAVEVFARGVTTSLVGVKIEFYFDASVLKFDKAENSAFLFILPEATGASLAATAPVTLPSSGFLARAEFSTVVDVTGREFTLGIKRVTLAESAASSDVITTTDAIAFNATPSPDFDGDGTVGFSDFLAFAGQYGSKRGDGRYEAQYDLDGNGAIGFSDFLIFANSYGQQVPPSGGGGGGGGGSSSSPDLIVESPSVSDNTLTTGQSFTLRATVRNQGTGSSAATTLRYYRSSNSTISTSDTEVGTDSVSGLSASGTSAESISLNAPSSAGTYYYGACVNSVTGESDTDNNCSDAVTITVSAPTLVAQHDDRVVVMGVPGRLRTDPIDFEALARVFFTHYEDAFDYLMVLSNLWGYDNGYYTYAGVHLSVQNDVEGTGQFRYSRNHELGSGGRLNAILHFPYNTALPWGPFLHEIIHSWANYTIPTAAEFTGVLAVPTASWVGSTAPIWSITEAAGIRRGTSGLLPITATPCRTAR